mmetsp:Transcript_62338/g.98844  ORF Transcript_62338/g.98844 Transcript_62338/m.98844 type:complete len:223 (-) Transcript_62338:175-843(-)
MIALTFVTACLLSQSTARDLDSVDALAQLFFAAHPAAGLQRKQATKNLNVRRSQPTAFSFDRVTKAFQPTDWGAKASKIKAGVESGLEDITIAFVGEKGDESLVDGMTGRKGESLRRFGLSWAYDLQPVFKGMGAQGNAIKRGVQSGLDDLYIAVGSGGTYESRREDVKNRVRTMEENLLLQEEQEDEEPVPPLTNAVRNGEPFYDERMQWSGYGGGCRGGR